MQNPVRWIVREAAGRIPSAPLLLALLVTTACCATAEAAPRTDIVILRNGDRLTGEVRSMERGQLSFKTDATGTITIEWDEIASLKTKQYLQVELTSGARYFGQAPELLDGARLKLAAGEDDKGRELEMATIVRIAAIDQGRFLDRLDGYATAGYNYTKASGLQQMTLTGGINSRDQKRQWSIDGSSTVTTQKESDDSRRYDLSAYNRRFLADRWFMQGFAGLAGNDELGLDLRGTLGAAYGRYLAQTRTQDWAAYVGLQGTREFYSQEDATSNLEAVFGTQYSFFRYDAPEASLDATLNLVPSLSQSGRVRSEAKLRSRYEIVNDLFFEVSVYHSYDSDPGEDAESNSDYGIDTSLGYSF